MYRKKASTKKKREKKNDSQPKLNSFFNMSNDVITINDNKNDSRKRMKLNTYNNKNVSQGSRFQMCPICNKSFPFHSIQRHASMCEFEPSPVSSSLKQRIAEPELKQTQMKKSKPKLTGLRTSHHDIKPVFNKEEVKDEWKKVFSQKSTNLRHDDSDQQEEADSSPSEYSQPLPGLFIFKDFISEEDEKNIMKTLDFYDYIETGENNKRKNVWKQTSFNGKHRGKQYGAVCSLRDRKVSAPEHPLPSCIQTMMSNVKTKLLDTVLVQEEKLIKPTQFKKLTTYVTNLKMNEANAIDYRKKNGDYLRKHVDDRQLSKEIIANVSLAGDCYMTFELEKKNKAMVSSSFLPQQRNGRGRSSTGVEVKKKILLERRTLQILTGSSRYDYSHAIANEDLLSERRISITMRESPLTR